MTSTHRSSKRPHGAVPAAIALLLVVSGCSDPDIATPTTTATTITEPSTMPPSTAPPSTPPRVDAVFTTAGPVSGNRHVSGLGPLGEAVDITLAGVPAWVVGAPTPSGVVWVVALDDGSIEAFRLVGGVPERLDVGLDRLVAGTPPVVTVRDGSVAVVAPPPDASRWSAPLPLANGGLVYVSGNGDLVVSGSATARLAVDALLDTRIVASSSGLLALLAEPTDRYGHGVLGDAIEAGRIVIVDPATATVVAEVVVPAPAVIEGISPLWGDLDGDGTDEILVTISDAEVGARLAVFSPDGTHIAASDPIGRGGRWRNQTAVAPTGPDGEIEVVDVLIPHIGGIVEFFQPTDERLEIVADRGGHTSHVIGSRNLDMALVADVDGDGRPEVVAPTQERGTIGIIARTADGAAVVTDLDLGAGRLVSNLSAVGDSDGRLWLAAGTTEGTLRVWPPG